MNSFSVTIVCFLFSSTLLAKIPYHHSLPIFKSQIKPISLSLHKKMLQYTLNANCPVTVNELREVKLMYFGFDGRAHQGSLIIHEALTKDVVHIFKELYLHRFPLQSMKLMDAYQGNDAASMAANNTSSFNCRAITGHPKLFSQHSYGRAIDINPLLNPYVKQKEIEPKAAQKFANREGNLPGKINRQSFIYQLFTEYGWDWGGNWYDVKDYHHFEKRANHAKRDPWGPSEKSINVMASPLKADNNKG